MPGSFICIVFGPNIFGCKEPKLETASVTVIGHSLGPSKEDRKYYWAFLNNKMCTIK